ncbi:putative CBS domain-containing protein [Helianthus anomalus]
MSSRHGSSSRRSMPSSSPSSTSSPRKKKLFTKSRSTVGVTGERTVKRLHLSRAVTVPEATTIYEACCRMAAKRIDAVLLIDSNAHLSGILTDKVCIKSRHFKGGSFDPFAYKWVVLSLTVPPHKDKVSLTSFFLRLKDIAARVIAHEIDFMNTPASKVMTKNPIYVQSDTLAVEALQKMVQGQFRHLPVVENGEVIALLDIAKCIHEAIARMERTAEKGNSIAAAVEGVEKHLETSLLNIE